MIVEWVAIGILVFLGFIFLKLEHHIKKIQIIAILIIGLMVYFSLTGHFNSEKVDLTSPKGIVNGIYLYVGWVGSTASSLWDIGTNTVHLVGNAIKINNTSEENPRR